MDGEVITLAAGDEYKELDLFDLKEKQCRATIAVASEKLYIRTGSTLYCFGKHQTSTKPR